LAIGALDARWRLSRAREAVAAHQKNGRRARAAVADRDRREGLPVGGAALRRVRAKCGGHGMSGGWGDRTIRTLGARGDRGMTLEGAPQFGPNRPEHRPLTSH